ncbi:unnamed protein product [Soboliphyme baturini]|uniref:Inosine triphosphate pyrophosphatase n=1 Tax=Soboliphyme baturini TaxID=241478 RepID=A0A183IJY4_9BILA|nr:unnamed protein product [Soboliphyme baturini]
MSGGRILTFVTSNENKLREVKRVLSPAWEVTSANIELPEYQGEPSQITVEKCKMAAEILKRPLIVEDTCLCFNAFGGLPGPYIKWFLQKLGTQGLYNLLNFWEDKSAYALCTFAYYDGNDMQNIQVFQGRTDGKIVAPRGPAYFGWDPCFEPNGWSHTFAEMGPEKKVLISHRTRALEKLRSALLQE